MFIIQVVLFLPIKKFFKYSCPKDITPIIGVRVSVPFGSRKVIGMIVSFYYQKRTINFKLKSIYSIIDKDPIYTQNLWNTLNKSSMYYHCSMGYILYTILPVFIKKGKHFIPIDLCQWIITKQGKDIDINILKKTPKQYLALSVLRHNSIFKNEYKKYNLSSYVLKKLKDKDLCDIYVSSHSYIDNKKNILIKDFDLQLNKKEYITIENILHQAKDFKSWLLTGMNYTVKKQIYCSLVLKFLKKGLQILILVANDNVVDQIVSLFQIYFNVPIDRFYSGTTNHQKLSIWFRAKNNKTSVIIGTKQAIFIPIAKLGIIIIDEEHSVSYKNKKGWCYNARDIGILRAYQEKIPIILESVSPTLETLKNVINKKYQHINLNRDMLNKKIIQKIIDVNSERLKGGLSVTLINKINEHIYNKNTVLLIINNNNCIFFILYCKHCKWIAKCDLCNEYYYFNEHYQELCCRFCFIRFSIPLFCFHCGSEEIVSRGFNMEYMKFSIEKIFSNMPVLCISYGNKKLKNIVNSSSFQCIVNKASIILIREKDIFDMYFLFCNVTLISMVLIDSYFTSTTFRSVERFAQFYTHSINLLNDHSKSLEVLIQTSYPNNTALMQLIQQGYQKFSITLLKQRSIAQLPPFTYHAIIYAKSKKYHQIEKFFLILQNIIKSKEKEYKSNFWMMGPFPESYHSIHKKCYVYKLLLQNSSRHALHNILKYSTDLISTLPIASKIKWSLDIDPIDM